MTDVKPGEVAERLEAEARFPNMQRSGVCADMRTAASLIRSLSERNEKLEGALKPFATIARLEELHGSTLGHPDVPDNHLSAVDFRDGGRLALSISGPSMGEFRAARAALERK